MKKRRQTLYEQVDPEENQDHFYENLASAEINRVYRDDEAITDDDTVYERRTSISPWAVLAILLVGVLLLLLLLGRGFGLGGGGYEAQPLPNTAPNVQTPSSQ